MSKIKICGLSRICDIEAVNELEPEYIGFVFAHRSRRYISPEKALELKKQLNPGIDAVGVFVNACVETVAELLNNGTIDIAQLHGSESEGYIKKLRRLTHKPIIKAFRIDSERDITDAKNSTADYVLLDSGNGGTGTTFDWTLIKDIGKPYFLAGGLNISNVTNAIKALKPYAVDVSSGVETEGFKDTTKMEEFISAVRKGD